MMNMNTSLLFFTAATGFYANYVIPYTYFAAKANGNPAFEYLVDDVDAFIEKHQKSLEWLEAYLKIPVVFRSISEAPIEPNLKNSYRFIIEPNTQTQFVYIGDVDIMICEDVYDWHKPIFSAGFPYSNVVRAGEKKLTGLHFVRRESFYPLPRVDDLVSVYRDDESLLYAITNRKGILYKNEEKNLIKPGRPIHGVHMSINRLPFSFSKERVGWGMKYEYLEKISGIIETDEFNDFYNTLYPGSAQVMINLIVLSAGATKLGKDFWKENIP